MRLSDVLVGVFWQKREVRGRDHFSKDRLSPLLARLVLKLDL